MGIYLYGKKSNISWTKKQIKVDYYFVRYVVVLKKICTSFSTSENQLADIFTKPLGVYKFPALNEKLVVISINAPTCGKVLELV